MGHRQRTPLSLMESYPRSRPLLQSALEVVRRPFVGPFLFGCIVGGIPLAILFDRLTFRNVASSEFANALELFPVAILATTARALLGRDVTWKSLLRRTFLTSVGSWIPLPAMVYVLVEWRLGYEVFALQNFPAAIVGLALVATMLTPPCWLLALGFAFLKNRNSHAGGSQAPNL